MKNKVKSVRDEQDSLLYYERQMFVGMVRVLCAQQCQKHNIKIDVSWDDEIKIEIVINNKISFDYNISFQMVMDTLGFERSITDSLDGFKYQLEKIIKSIQ